MRCLLREYPDKYGISDFLCKINPSKGWCATALYIPMWGPCEDVFFLTVFQYSWYAAKLVRFRGSLSETVVGRCRCLKNVFTSGSVLYGQTYITSIIASTCGISPKALIYKYNQWSSSNGQAPSVWYYFFKFFAIITFSGGVLSVIYSVLKFVCCWVTKVAIGFLNLPSMYLIRLVIVWTSSLLFILRICVDTGTLTASYKALARLLWYSMLRASAWLFDTLIPEYTDQSPVVISASLVLDVTCGNFHCSWVSRWSLYQC